MRKLFAALVGAAAAMPFVSWAAPSFPDPSNPGASVPDLTVAPAFASYHAYEDKNAGSWSALNRDAVDSVGMKGMDHGDQMPPSGSSGNHGHLQPGRPSK